MPLPALGENMSSLYNTYSKLSDKQLSERFGELREEIEKAKKNKHKKHKLSAEMRVINFIINERKGK
jgi:uncharacterized small protein (DUF1192 family)